MSMGGGWVLDADIEGYYDNLDHGHLRSFLDQRVRDGVLRRAVDKWLKAGVMEEGNLSHPITGTPQGGVISPLLSNIYLHEVLDVWFETAVKPRLHGEAFLIRFVDDFVLVFQLESDARRVLEVLPKRFGRYGLRLHPDKTRLVRFEPPRSERESRQDHEKPRSFDFLGFTHHWEKSRWGRWMVKRKTAPNRVTRALRRINLWCQDHRHAPIPWQHAKLERKLRGHDESRDLRKLQSPEQFASLGQENLAQVAESPLADLQGQLGTVQPSLETLPATQPENPSCGLRTRSEPVT
jgi:hypothetical protein